MGSVAATGSGSESNPDTASGIDMGSVSNTGSGTVWKAAAESEASSGIDANSGIGADSGATSADDCASGSGAGPATGAPQLVQNLVPSFSCAPQLVQNMAYPHIIIGSCRDYHIRAAAALLQLYRCKGIIGMRRTANPCTPNDAQEFQTHASTSLAQALNFHAARDKRQAYGRPGLFDLHTHTQEQRITCEQGLCHTFCRRLDKLERMPSHIAVHIVADSAIID